MCAQKTFHLHRIVLLPVVLTHHAVDVVRRDGGVGDPLIALASPGADVKAIGTCPAPRGGGVQAHQLDQVVGVTELAVDGGGHQEDPSPKLLVCS